MKLVGEVNGSGDCGGVSGVDGGGGAVVVVGVKLDARSRELLTWALVKVAQPGDRVLALHVLENPTDGTSSLLSLVQTFDSVLAVYEGFCNLKQVDLKLKVCRGPSAQKILVREAKSYDAAKVIVGTSKSNPTYRSSASVAKYCARKLAKSFWVLAVNNGKIVFQREATDHSQGLADGNQCKNYLRLVHLSLSSSIKVRNEKLNQESCTCSQKSDFENCKSCSPTSALPDNYDTELLKESCGHSNEDNSLALVPYHTNEAASISNNSMVQRSSMSKPGWQLLRKVFLPKRPRSDKPLKKMSVVQWVLRLPGRYSSAVVYPDQKQSRSFQEDDKCSSLDGENGAIVAVGVDAACPPVSPYNGLKSFHKELGGLLEKYSSTCRLFSYQDLVSATSNFMPENMVGKGGSSHVYRGCLPDGVELAVKNLKPSEEALKEFVLEIEIITTLHHKNIISLFGFCFEDSNLLLVYDFLSRGSLEENLHGHKRDENEFGWQERYKVAVGVAEALDYLHNDCTQPVIHRDVKSSNILLSDDFEPRLADFGLANFVSTSSSYITCIDVAGTFGYLAPEYFMHGKVSDKIDVYAFGVVLLELLSGRKPINNENPKGQESLIMWAKPILKGEKVSQLLDPSLGCDCDNDQIERMVLAATLCIRRAPRLRPQIGLVLKLLQGDGEVTNWARQQVSASEELLDDTDGEAFPTNIQSHLNLALLDSEDDSLSDSSTEQNISIENYLQGRWSRSVSFD